METAQGNLGRIQGVVANVWEKVMNTSDVVDRMLKSLQEMGEKDKEQNPAPAGIYSKESVGKVT